MAGCIRILQVLGRLDRGGAETMVMNLYRHMDRDNIQFDFVIHTEEDCDYTEEIRRLGGKIYSMKPFCVSTAMKYRKQWREFFCAHREYHVIHGHVRSTASLYLAEAKKAGLVTIVHSHNTSSGKGFSALVKNVLQFPLRYQADYLFACGTMAGQWLYGKKACCQENFRIFRNGVQIDDFAFDERIRQKVRRSLGIENKAKIFFHAGRFEEQKNHNFLIQIMTEIHKMEPKANLLLCGTGILEEEIKSLVRKRGLSERVWFLGVRQDVNELMQAADVMLFPSLFEGAPVTVIEAQSAGLPVLMSDHVTEEVALTELAHRLSLGEGSLRWAKEALRLVENPVENRDSYGKVVAAQGYDVRENAGRLERFYRSL